MGFLILVVGLILWLAGAAWFTGAATVGVILVIAGAVLWFFEALVYASAAKTIREARKDLRSQRPVDRINGRRPPPRF